MRAKPYAAPLRAAFIGRISAATGPLLEAFRSRGHSALLLDDPGLLEEVDVVCVQVSEPTMSALVAIDGSPSRAKFVLVAVVDVASSEAAALAGADQLVFVGAVEEALAGHLALAERQVSAMRAHREISSSSEASLDVLEADRVRLIAAVEQSSDAILITSAQGVIEFANPAIERSTGYSREELIGETPRVFKSATHDAEYFEEMWGRLARGEAWSGELVNRKKDGTLYVEEATISPVRDANGETTHFIAVKRDISERKRIEEELRASEERFRAIVENCPAVLFGLDADGVFQVSEGRGLVSLGLAPGQVVGQSAFDVYMDYPVVTEAIRTALGGQSVVREVEVEGLVFEAFYSPIRNSEGRVVSVFGMAIERTGHRRAQAALSASEQRLRAIFDSAADHMMLLDESFEIQMINRVVPELSRDMVLGKSMLDFTTGEERERVAGLLSQVLERGEVQHWDYAYVGLGGALMHFTANAAPVTVAGRVSNIVVSSRDVTTRIELEQENKQLEEQYRQAQKMEAVGQLAGGVAHDFNNVLCVITANSALALSDLSTVDPLRVLMLEIEEAAERAAELTRQLLAFSSKRPTEFQGVDLGRLVREMHSMLDRVIGDHVTLKCRSLPGTGAVWANSTQLEQVVINLAVNARDAMPSGGTLTIEAADVMLDEAYRGKHARASEKPHVRLSVNDTGCGMSADVRKRIFEPFFTTKGPGRGTGLGLATVFGIVEQSGGWVDVSSEPGGGTTFDLYFPCYEGDVTAAPSKVSTVPNAGIETVLLLDDDELVRRSAARLLGRCGYEVLVAGSGQEAVDIATRHDGEIALLLTDVVMPDLSGPAVAKAIVELRPEIKVLFVSGYNEGIEMPEGADFMSKPYSLDSLSSRIRELLDG